MDNAFSRLLKVLALERKQGYRNKAVIGGLDKFASRWESDARNEAGSVPAVSEVVALLIGYPAIEDPQARERIIEQIVRRVREISPAAAAHLPVEPSAQPPAPVAPAVEPPAQPPTPTLAAPPAPAAAAALREPAMTRPRIAPGDSVHSERPANGPTDLPAAPAVPPAVSPPAPVAPANASLRPVPPTSKPEAPAAPEQPPVRPAAEPPPAALPAAPPVPPLPARPVAPTGLDAPVTRLPGIGPSFATRLLKLGVTTVRDLLYLLPHRYEDYSQLRTIDKLRWGEQVTVIGSVWKLGSRIIGEDRRLITAVVGDGTGEMEMTWFNPFVERRLQTGRAYMFGGKVENYRDRLVMRNPEFEPLERGQVHTGRLTPLYPLTDGITAHWLREAMDRAVEAFSAEVDDFVPVPVRVAANLLPLGEALKQIHFPDNRERLAQAHRRLSFDEFLVLQLAVLGQRGRFQGRPARVLAAGEAVLAPFLAALPFGMTAAQQRSLREIAADLGQPRPMARLLQGDVGSGKTAVAAAALWAAVANGAQGAIMAPTEILAEQHGRSFGRLFADLPHPTADRPIRIALFTGSQRRAERVEALAALAAGEVDIAIGTHALIQEDVAFRELAVAVVDEQHRFGVEQRAALRGKGAPPHILVMSATPIPRSLALTLYGDLDVSVIDQMPPGRTPIKTKWLASSQRERAYDFIRRQAAEGRQAYVIYPLVAESDRSDAKAAIEEHARLSSQIFPGLRLGLVHGRLPGDEKDAVMRAFSAGELDVLVATSVVEVGVDVPNATVIVIEGAERFGLAQLHQFRGRVGRGQYPSYCILISDAGQGEGVQRLEALETNNDGFALAQIDLEMRGPGDFFGTRQSGLPPLRTAQLSDVRTLELARSAAQRIYAADPALSRPEHRALAVQVAAFWRAAADVS